MCVLLTVLITLGVSYHVLAIAWSVYALWDGARAKGHVGSGALGAVLLPWLPHIFAVSSVANAVSACWRAARAEFRT